jgi:hypothetical protein
MSWSLPDFRQMISKRKISGLDARLRREGRGIGFPFVTFWGLLRAGRDLDFHVSGFRLCFCEAFEKGVDKFEGWFERLFAFAA